MKSFTGIILNVFKKAGAYEVARNGDNSIIKIWFAEFPPDVKLKKGDVVNFAISHSSADLKATYSHPTVLYNIYFKQLTEALESGDAIEGIAFQKNTLGLSVSYNGYSCLLPYSETKYNDKIFPSEFLFLSMNNYAVKEVQGTYVKLTRKKIEQEELLHAPGSKYPKPQVTNHFTGILFKTKFDRLEIAFNCYIGSIPLQNIFQCTIGQQKELLKHSKLLHEFNHEVFLRGGKITVTVQSFKKGNYLLNWSPLTTENIPLKEKFDFLLKEKKYEVLWATLYKKQEDCFLGATTKINR